MTLPKFLLSGFSTIMILVIGWPIIWMYPSIRFEKATGLMAFSGGLTGALFTPQFWFSAILLLLFFWFTSQLNSKILRLLSFWIPTVFATVIGLAFFALLRYVHTHSPR